MAIRKIIKNIIFNEDIRKDLVFSDSTKIRLNTENKALPRLMLVYDPVNGYSTDTDITVDTPLMTPMGVRKWLKFEMRVVEDPDSGYNVPPGTSVRLKVKTTAGNYWWDGAAWAVAGATDWNTEAEINANISTFPIATVGNKSIGFVVNLVTTKTELTPEVLELKLLGEFEIEFLDSLIYDGVIRTLNSSFRSSSVLVAKGAGLASIDLNTVLTNKGYNVTGIRSVYNLTADPLRLTDLYQSYTPGALKQDGFTNEPGSITLSSPIPLNERYEVVFEYVPEIFVRQHQDYYEVPAYPSIVFESISIVDLRGFIIRDTNGIGDYIRDKPNLTAVFQRGMRQNTVRFQWAIFTNSQIDQVRLTNDFNQFWANNKLLKEYNLDCRYGISLVGEFDTSRNQSSPDDTDTNVATGAFDVLGALAFDKPAIDVPLVGPGKVLGNFSSIES